MNYSYLAVATAIEIPIFFSGIEDGFMVKRKLSQKLNLTLSFENEAKAIAK